MVVQEDVGVAEVCVVVYSPRLDCPIVFPFEILITTIDGIDGGAGNLEQVSNLKMQYHLLSVLQYLSIPRIFLRLWCITTTQLKISRLWFERLHQC